MSKPPELQVSPLSQNISSEGHTISVQIYKLETESSWVLEIEDEFGNSTTWDDTFESDSAALAEAKQTILDEGITSLIGAPEEDEPEATH